VSNFGLGEIAELLKLAKIKPAVLEARSDPFAINHHLINVAVEKNITFVGYSSLGTQWINSPAAINPIFTNAVLQVSVHGSRALAAGLTC
jgi:diketogulonate reductase-like aldo/keto reductase